MNGEQLRNKTPTYYAIMIIMALIPQILGFNASIVADIWKVLVIIVMMIFVSQKSNNSVTTNMGLLYIIYFVVISVVSLIIDTSASINTVFNIGSSIILIYLFFDYPSRDKHICENNVLQFFKIFSIFIFIACIYNMVVNFNQLIHITSNTVYGNEAVTSFFDNKNTFGMFLTFGSISATYMRVIEGRAKWLFFMFIFLINELMAMCRTAIILTIIFLIISFLVGDRKTRNTRIIILSGLLLSGLILYLCVPAVRGFVNNSLFGDTSSLDIRDGYVESMLPLARGVRLIFGYGNGRSSTLAYLYTGNRYYHNTYLHLLISGGILKLGFFILGIIYSISVSLKLHKLNRKTGYMCLATIAAYLVYATIESIILFDTPVIAMVATIFVISIPRMLLNAQIYSEL